MQRLNCPVQNYAWGRLGLDSSVAALKASADGFPVEGSQPYAELWMGTHPKAPSTIAATSQPLSAFLAQNPSAVGASLAPVLAAKFSLGSEGWSLPFLFKVLSVQKALSIQVHPSKAQAKLLHAADPTNYRDDNHKPEMAIALTPFELLCGFRPPTEILDHIRNTPELFELVGGPAFVELERVVKAGLPEGSEEAKAALKDAFSALMSSPAVLVERCVASLTERVALACQSQHETASAAFILAELLIRLNFSFPGDVGVLAPFFLNHFSLRPGEAVFLGPNEPHAYLYGDCVECMANSDNVIRAGLTPKFKDVKSLLSHLSYRMAPSEANKFPATEVVACPGLRLLAYDPPTPEFVVHRAEVLTDAKEPRLPSLPICSVAIVTEGPSEGELRRGSVILVPAGMELPLPPAPFILFRAFADEKDLGNL